MQFKYFLIDYYRISSDCMRTPIIGVRNNYNFCAKIWLYNSSTDPRAYFSQVSTSYAAVMKNPDFGGSDDDLLLH